MENYFEKRTDQYGEYYIVPGYQDGELVEEFLLPTRAMEQEDPRLAFAFSVHLAQLANSLVDLGIEENSRALFKLKTILNKLNKKWEDKSENRR